MAPFRADAAIAYAIKTITYTHSLRAELHHPVRLAFTPTASIALLLLAAASLDFYPTLSALLW